jgi:hypothetical protein
MATEINKPIVINGHKFYPLARVVFKLKCEIKVDLHVNHEIASVITNVADLDNRLKTLFDALRMPKEPHEIKDHMPNIDEFCCLLENDIIISALQIETFRNTAVPTGASLDHVRLNMVVTLDPMMYDYMNEPFRHD